MGDGNEYRTIADAGLGGISAVVSSLPAGMTLGEARVVNGVKYRLISNGSNSQAVPGTFLTPVNAGGATPYSMTVTCVSQQFNHVGAALVVHATLTTGTYGWGAVYGSGLKVIGDNTSIPTGSAFYISGSSGQVTLFPQSLATGNVVAGVNNGGAASKTVTTGAASGDCLIVLD